jgi:hypothetical protein
MIYVSGALTIDYTRIKRSAAPCIDTVAWIHKPLVVKGSSVKWEYLCYDPQIGRLRGH